MIQMSAINTFIMDITFGIQIGHFGYTVFILGICLAQC